MSAELYYTGGPGGNNANPQGTTVGGTKPLHRFIKGQPKIIGIIVLVLGASFFILSTVVVGSSDSGQPIWSAVSYGFFLGTLFIICGILYIVTEHNPTKKTVTASLALTIVTILGIFWTVLYIVPDLIHSHYRYSYYSDEDSPGREDEAWTSHYETMALVLEATFVFYSFVGGIIFIVMSSLAGAALRSTKSQAVIVMTTAPTETPAE